MNDFFEFSNNVKIITGDTGFEWAASRLHRLGGNRVFLITDKNIQNLGHVDFLSEELAKDSVLKITTVYCIEDHTQTTQDISKAYNAFRESACDSIIAFGGSRVLNLAKCLVLLLSTNSRNIKDYIGIDCAIRQKTIPFGIVSTTFGSGKEVSRTAMIIDSERKIPLEIVSDVLQPDFCIINSRFLKTLPEKEIYLSLIDALVYDIESYISLRTNTLSQSFAKMSMFCIKSNLQVAINKKDEESLYNLQRAAALAGVAYSNTYVGLMHAIGNALTAKYEIQHVTAIICVLTESLKFLQDTCAKEFGQMLLFSLGAKDYASLDDELRPVAFINVFNNMTRYIADEFGIKIKLSDYGIKEEDLDAIASLASKDGALITCPKPVTKEDIINILRNSL